MSKSKGDEPVKKKGKPRKLAEPGEGHVLVLPDGTRVEAKPSEIPEATPEPEDEAPSVKPKKAKVRKAQAEPPEDGDREPEVKPKKARKAKPAPEPEPDEDMEETLAAAAKVAAEAEDNGDGGGPKRGARPRPTHRKARENGTSPSLKVREFVENEMEVGDQMEVSQIREGAGLEGAIAGLLKSLCNKGWLRKVGDPRHPLYERLDKD